MATPKLRHGLTLVGVVALSCFSATALVPPPRPHASPSARPHSAGASSSVRFGTRTVLAAATVPAAEVEAKATAPPFSVSSTGVTSQVTFSGCGGLYCYFFGVAAYIQRHYNTSGTVFAGASAGTFPGTVAIARSSLPATCLTSHHHRHNCPRTQPSSSPGTSTYSTSRRRSWACFATPPRPGAGRRCSSGTTCATGTCSTS